MSGGGEQAEVRLVGVPLALYAEATEHTDGLRREFALMARGESSGASSVPTRLLRVIEELDARYGGFAEGPDAELAAALERGEQRIDVVYRLPIEAKEAALTLAALLDEADAFCIAGGHLLTLATPAGSLAFRRWFLGEFAAQIDGAAPTPWEESAFYAALAHSSGDVPPHEGQAEVGRTVDQLAETFAEVARTLQAADSLEGTLTKIVELAVKSIDGCDHAGVTLVDARGVHTHAASDEIPQRVDAIQYRTGEGPCFDAMREHEVFQTDDLATEYRWPRFVRRAAEETKIASMISYRLFIAEETLGALNLYSEHHAAFGVEDRAVGSIFAAHASVALAAAVEHRQLQQALATRDVIGQAKGILMAHQHVSADEAFDVLRRGSQRLNIKLRELAENIARGTMPPRPPAV